MRYMYVINFMTLAQILFDIWPLSCIKDFKRRKIDPSGSVLALRRASRCGVDMLRVDLKRDGC